MTAPMPPMPPMPSASVLAPASTAIGNLNVVVGPGSGSQTIPLPVGTVMGRVVWDGSAPLEIRRQGGGFARVLAVIPAAPTGTIRTAMFEYANSGGGVLAVSVRAAITDTEVAQCRAGVTLYPTSTST